MELKNKVTIIGAGFVGSTSAYSLIASGGVQEIALIDINKSLVRAEVMDLQHSVPFWGYSNVKVGSYNDIKDSKIVVIAAGAAQKDSTQDRLELASKNVSLIKKILPEIFKKNQNAIVVIVSNPVDVLTYFAVKMFPKKKKQIFGSGTVLDSARFRFLLSQKLSVNPSSIHAYIVGEHGESELALWSTATIGNSKLDSFGNLTEKEKNKIFEQAKNAAYTIIEGKKATYYAIGAGVAQIAKAILFDQKTVLPVSHFIENKYGIDNVCISMPAIVGKKGIIESLPVGLNSAELKLLAASAKKLKKINSSL